MRAPSPARLAGLLYLVVVLTGVFGLAYVPSRLSLSGDSWANAGLIAANLPLYRVGQLVLLVNQMAFLVLPLALWRVLHRHGEAAAALMVAFAVVSVPVVLAAIGHRLDAIGLLTGPAISDDARTAAALALEAARNRMLLAMTFWGLWLFPLGWLVWRSRLAPRGLAVLLMLGCLGYLVQVTAAMLAVELGDGALGTIVRLPASLGEIGLCLWLVLTAGRYPGWWPGQSSTRV